MNLMADKLVADKHVRYILMAEKKKDSFESVVMDHLRMNGAYWGLTTLDLLEKLGSVSEDEVVSWVMTCQHESGGFAGNTGHDPHVLYTLSAVQILALFDKLNILDVGKVSSYVAGLQNEDGSFSGDMWGEVDTRFSYVAICCLSILKCLDKINVEKAVDYIVSCKNLDGGFGCTPGAESHAGQIFCCVGALAITGNLHHVDKDLLGWWLCERQDNSGGLNGRPKKDPDVCYSWWVLSSLIMIDRVHWIKKARLVKFILDCQDMDNGGISDRPNDAVDIFHTYFGVAGLSLLEYPGVKPIDPAYALPVHVRESGFVTVSNSTILDGLNKQTVPSVQASGSVSLEHHAPTGITSQWKMILHEESNQYYYWNTETGETSWEIPADLTQTASAYGTGYNESGPMVTDVSTLISGVEPSYLLPVQNSFTGTDCSTFPTVTLDERNKSEDLYVKSLGTDGHQVECRIDSVVNIQPCQEDLARPEKSDHGHTNFDTEAATDLPSRLLSQSEGLLEKLRSLKRSHVNFHSNEQISKYILEVEVRHSDVKALILDTSPLLSFWLHTEKQLKRLEDSVNDEIYQLAKSAVMDEIAETNKSPPKEKLVADANTESESEDSGREGELAQSGKSLHSDESADVSSNGSPKHSQSHPAGQSDIIPSTEKAGSPDVEDIDMEVDMEVEESVPVSSVQVIDASDGKIFRIEPSNLHTDVPPPPGEEWIPPPPYESEDVPPPPPDSYGEPIPPPPENGDVPPSLSSDSLGVPYTVPQSYMQQSADYATQYNLSYPESNYQYIANAVAVDPNTQFYGHVDGSQVSLPQSTFYYETVPGTSEAAPAAASAGEAYYNFNGAAPLFPVISSVESSLHHSGVGSANYNITSNSSTAVVPSSRSNDPAEIASSGTASQSTDVTGGSSVLAKGQTKVKRPKKRTVAATSTLRSNKKVSSLVDKWKAAKEELNESEEEEDDYGILDRKRQREIEEWKSRHIASGEAKDNANFQPLIGDWREKVKRKRERAEKSQKKDDEKQQKPDLTKLSANLPSGWQAYWDESTKKGYYGNTSTSQTSWTRPTT